jgi:hypothetical protein
MTPLATVLTWIDDHRLPIAAGVFAWTVLSAAVAWRIGTGIDLTAVDERPAVRR